MPGGEEIRDVVVRISLKQIEAELKTPDVAGVTKALGQAHKATGGL